MAATKTLQERQKDFDKRLKKLYPDYKLLSEYTDSRTKVTLEHIPTGEIWNIEPRFLNGRKQAPEFTKKMRMKRVSENNFSTKRLTQEEFEIKFYQKYQFSEYEVVGKYVNSQTPIDILHKKCGKIFSTSSPSNLLYQNVKGCPYCYGKIKRTLESTNAELIEKGFNDYSVSKVWTKDGHSYGHFTHTCDLCNNSQFDMRITDFFSKHDQKCPICKVHSNQSRGIKAIKRYLKKNKIKFETEVRFEECKDKLYLPFDIYIEDMNLIIEFDGIQHFKKVDFFCSDDSNSFETTKKHDKIKNKFCKDYDINLLRIKYNENIEKKLDDYFNNN